MARKPSLNTTGSGAVQEVDELLGEAYRVVRVVEANLDVITEVASKIDDVSDAAGAVQAINAAAVVVAGHAATVAADKIAAAASKVAAELAETNAELAETNAEAAAAGVVAAHIASETARDVAGNFADEADASALAAANSAAAALVSQNAAAGSASSASGSAGTATGQANTAGNYKTAAETAEANAQTALTNALAALASAETARDAALTAKAAAEAAQAAAEAGFDNFDDRWLGSKATNPTLDNDGNALQDGAIYWNSTAKQWRAYDLDTTGWYALVAGAASASAIESTPAGDIDSDNVQDALNELDSKKLSAADFDTDATMAANSDSKIASQKAVKTYVDNKVGNLGSMMAVTDEFVGNGTAVYTLSHTPIDEFSCWPVVGGVEQPPSTFSLAAAIITFSEVVPTGLAFHVKYFAGQLVIESVVNANLSAASAVAAAASAATATTKAAEADASKVTAGTSATTATAQAVVATTQAGISTTKAAEALADKNTATTQAGISTAQAVIATTQAGISTTKAGEAAASAATAASQAAAMLGSSTTSIAIGLGSKTLTTQPGKSFAVGTDLKLTSNASPTTHYLSGVVTAYDNSTGALTLLVGKFGGAGSRDDWSVRVSGTYANSILAGQEVVLAVDSPVTQAHRGALVVANSATPITLTVDAPATLGAEFIAILTNAGAGLLTIPIFGGAAFSDGATSKIVAQGSSVIISGNGTVIRALQFAGGGGGGGSGGTVSFAVETISLSNQSVFTLSQLPISKTMVWPYVGGIFQPQDAFTLSNATITLSETVGVDAPIPVDIVYATGAPAVFLSERYFSGLIQGNGTAGPYSLGMTDISSDNAVDMIYGGVIQPKTSYTLNRATGHVTWGENVPTTTFFEARITPSVGTGIVPTDGVGALQIKASEAAAIKTKLGITASSRNDGLFGLELADIKGVVQRLADGVADAFDDETGLATGSNVAATYNPTSDLYSPTSVGDTYGTLNDPTFGTDNTGGGALNVRQQISTAGYLANLVGNRLQLTLRAANASGMTMSNVYVGHKGATAPDFDGGQVRVTFGGGNAGVIPANGTLVSDPIALTFDYTKDLIVSFDTANFIERYSTGVTGHNQWTKAGTGEAALTTAGGYASGAGKASVVDKVEVRTAIGARNNLTLVSNAWTALVQPTKAKVGVQFIDNEAITVNTHLLAWASRDNGVTWTQVTLLPIVSSGTVKYWEGEADISAQPAGTTMRWKVTTSGNKNIDVSGATLQWSTT